MKKIIPLALAVLGCFASFAQSYDITGIKKINPNDVKPLVENGEVKGYYAFAALDKASKADYRYHLALLDNNLKQTYSVELLKPKKLLLLESSYNGERFCFSFFNPKKRILDYTLLDKTGKTVGTYSLQISKRESQLYMSHLINEEDYFNGSLVAVKGKGFVRFGMEKEDGLRVDIEMIDNSGKKLWGCNSNVTTKKSYEAVNPFLSDERVVIAGLSTRESLMNTKKVKYSVMFINVNTGKEYFRLENKNEKYSLSPSGATMNSNGQTYFVYGQYYNPDDNLSKDDSKGMYLQEVDLSGKILAESYTEWEGQVNTMMVTKAKGNIEKNMKIFIHQVVKTADGKIFAIGEQYRKAVSGLGVASAVLSGGRGGMAVMKIEMYNMIVFEYDAAMKFKDVTIFEKEKSNVQLPSGMGVVDANMLGYMMKIYNQFDYAFTVISTDKKTFNSAYLNYDRQEGSKYTVGNISYTRDQKLAIDKVKLTTRPNHVLEAKPGYVGILEYFRKEKKLILRLEKLNL